MPESNTRVTNKMKGMKAMPHGECNREQLKATAEELRVMTDLIKKYPAEAQLIMAAIEDGLTLGDMHVMETDSHQG
jgi:hypothetical protein